jgi:hypothetical protein
VITADALQPCTACGNGLSPLARTCPQCGHPGPGQIDVDGQRARNGRWLLAVGSLLALVFTYYGNLGLGPIGLGMCLVGLVALAQSFKRPRVAIIGGRVVLGIVVLLLIGGATS